AGNWKMNGTTAALEQLDRLSTLIVEAGDVNGEVLVCPPATLLHRAAETVNGSAILVGGQDCHGKTSGAHTGDISAAMLSDCGASHVIVGHSERRADHAETSAEVQEKAQAALAVGLIPIICVGETEAERVSGRANQIVAGQLRDSVPEPDANQHIVVAYEPVWAIGTGKTASTDDIAQMHAHIRGLLIEILGEKGTNVHILYGGSVKPSNAEQIL